jgi:hypothetical protein
MEKKLMISNQVLRFMVNCGPAVDANPGLNQKATLCAQGRHYWRTWPCRSSGRAFRQISPAPSPERKSALGLP